MIKRKRVISIKYLVEGQTELNYIKDFVKEELGDDFKFSYENVKNGNYLSFEKILHRAKGTNNIYFVIVDLDRVKDSKEIQHLLRMIQACEFTSNFCNVFLSYKNFEIFLKSHFDNCKSLTEKLQCDHDDIKSNQNIYQTIKNKGGRYENTIKNLSKDNLCYCKITSKNTKLDKNKLMLKQSGLINFKSYCEYIKNNYN